MNKICDDDALDILRLRRWHHILNEKLKRNEFKIPIHLAFGYEATAVAMDRSMETGDKLCLSHRNIAYNLARIKSLEVILRHYNLSSPSPTGALMGSMNLAVEETDIAYTSSILGNNLAVATGIAMHRSLVHDPGVVFVVTGDGAMEEGVFWETLIFSRSHRLPLVIVVENNDCSLASTIAQRRSNIDLSSICAGTGIRYITSSGTAYHEVKKTLDTARKSASAGKPACVELDLATFCRHAGPTPGWPDDPLCLSIEDGLLVENSPRDPLYHVCKTLGKEKFRKLSKQVMEE